MIYQTVTEQDFIRAFDDMDRSESFSRQARRVLFEYFDDISDDIGEDIELDPIAICCEWGEYTAEELMISFGHCIDAEEREDDESFDDLFDDLCDNLEFVGILIRVEKIGEPDTFIFAE